MPTRHAEIGGVGAPSPLPRLEVGLDPVSRDLAMYTSRMRVSIEAADETPDRVQSERDDTLAPDAAC